MNLEEFVGRGQAAQRAVDELTSDPWPDFGWAANENARKYRAALELLERAADRAYRRGAHDDMNAYHAAMFATQEMLDASRRHLAYICEPWFVPSKGKRS